MSDYNDLSNRPALHAPAGDDAPFLMLSGHDYRSKRKANVHFIARELALRGKTRFFSLGFSLLSRIKRDPRVSLWYRAGKVEEVSGVECYLWRTFLHPVNLHRAWLRWLERITFRWYASRMPPVLRQWIRESNTIIFESGMSVVWFHAVRALNPKARVIYLCSDALDTIGCSPYLLEQLRAIAPMLDGIRIPSLKLVEEFPPGASLYFIPHGLDEQKISTAPSPYGPGVHLVSVGSMLFDPEFFRIAAGLFPEYTFHVIGGGKKAEVLDAPNIVVRGEMPYEETVRYLQYAQAGIAPYEGEKVSSYLVDTSMKLMQFEAYGIPAICPNVAAGNKAGRFGYVPGDADSIREAIAAALACGTLEKKHMLSWAEVTERILYPERFPDTYVTGRAA